MVVFSWGYLGGSADETEQAEDGAYQLSPELRSQSADCQGDKPGAHLASLGLVELRVAVELAVDSHHGVEQGEMPQDASWQPGEEACECRCYIVDTELDVYREVGRPDRPCYRFVIQLGAVVAIELLHNANRSRDSKDAAGFRCFDALAFWAASATQETAALYLPC